MKSTLTLGLALISLTLINPVNAIEQRQVVWADELVDLYVSINPAKIEFIGNGAYVTEYRVDDQEGSTTVKAKFDCRCTEPNIDDTVIPYEDHGRITHKTWEVNLYNAVCNPQ